MTDESELRQVLEGIDRLTAGAATRAATPPVAEETMLPRFQRIVVGVDGSEFGLRAARWAREIAKKHGSMTWLLAVTETAVAYPDMAGGVQLESVQERARAALEKSSAVFSKESLPFETVLRSGSPATEISRFAASNEADLIIVGSHGRRRLGRWLLGSVAEGVKNRAPCSVLIARAPPPVNHILVGVDGSVSSKRATAHALRLRHLWQSEVTVFHAICPPTFSLENPRDPRLLRLLGDVDDGMRGRKDIHFGLNFGVPAEALLAEARRRKANLLVVGARGLGTVERLLLGSVSQRLSHEAQCSILIVKEPQAHHQVRETMRESTPVAKE